MNNNKILELHKRMIKEGQIPKLLYKHIGITENLKKSLTNSELWFSPPTSFNDPFDCQINDQTIWTDDNIREYVSKNAIEQNINVEDIINENKKNPRSFNLFFTKNLKQLLAKQGVSCFLPTPKNLLLWAHYSDSHKGVCLKFDITKDPQLFSLTFNVLYSKDYPKFDYLQDRKKLVDMTMRTKSNHWKYEKEIRVFKPTFGNFPFSKDCLTEIIFGCKADPLEIAALKQIVDNAKYPNLKFSQVKLKENKFDIEIINI